MENKLFSKVNQLVESYETDPIQIVNGLEYNQHKTLVKIEFYWNSKYINGQKDDLGRPKPFFNISKFRTNVATRATDLDVKDIRAESDNPKDRVKSMLFNHEIYNWMKETNFSSTLNLFGSTRAKYGGALLKKTKKDGKLLLEVVDWKNAVTDQVDILGGVIIERHYLSPIDLAKKREVWKNVDEVIKLAETTDKNNSKRTEKKVTVLEVHGEFSEDVLPDVILKTLGVEKPEKNKYHRLMFLVAGDKKGQQYLLYHEKETELPYKYLAWDKVTGRALGIGIVEDGFEAQTWTNDAVMAEKNIMDLAGKVFIKTNSKTIGQNALSDMPNGMVITLQDGEDANLLNLLPNSIPQFQNLVDKWNNQYERATNTFEAVTGETLPSNTPLGSVAIQSAQASSFFDYRREEAGIFWTEVFTDWVLPFISKTLNTEHILASDFSAEELEYIDESFITNEVNDLVKKAVLEDSKQVSAQDVEAYRQARRQFIEQDGKRRYLQIPKDYFKDYEAKLTIDPTGEKRNKQTALQSLDNILAKIGSNPAILQDPNAVKLLNAMLEKVGLDYIFFKPTLPTPTVTAKSVPTSKAQSALERQTEMALPEAQV